jgi:ribose 5-phosphate isomerase B
MKLAIGCDHVAVELKKIMIDHFEENGHEVIDVGTNSTERTHYPIYANLVCNLVQKKEVDKGILICGTGIGMSIAANKHRGIRAVACSDTFSAKASREHNDTNVLCFGSRVVGQGLACDIADTFLGAEFEGGRHQIRVDMLNDIE